MKTVKDIPFRDIRGCICFIAENDSIKNLNVNDYMQGNEKANGLLCYGYIDYNAGISFEVLCQAYKAPDNTINTYEGNKNKTLKLRFSDVANCQIILLDDIQLYNTHSSKIEGINEYYRGTKALEKLRSQNFAYLDPFRNSVFPDDIQATLGAESLWVRCKNIREDIFYGTLLNEPTQSCGLHQGDEVMFKYINDNKPYCEIIM